MEEVVRTNRDPHLLYVKLGLKNYFVSEVIVRGAFFALWVRNNPDFCDMLAARIHALVQEPEVG